MSSEREKMLAGELYDPADPELAAGRERARFLCKAFNDSFDRDHESRKRIIRELFGVAGEDVWIEPPFHCDYGSNITMGKKVYFNFNCVILDSGRVVIGDHVLFGPCVQIYTPGHPLDALERRSGLESARPIEIGDDVWIGGGAILCPGVHIGARSVIGAGSVVTRDIPEGVLAVGNPCKVVRPV